MGEKIVVDRPVFYYNPKNPFEINYGKSRPEGWKPIVVNDFKYAPDVDKLKKNQVFYKLSYNNNRGYILTLDRSWWYLQPNDIFYGISYLDDVVKMDKLRVEGFENHLDLADPFIVLRYKYEHKETDQIFFEYIPKDDLNNCKFQLDKPNYYLYSDVNILIKDLNHKKERFSRAINNIEQIKKHVQ